MERVLPEVEAHALAGYPFEVCGFLLGLPYQPTAIQRASNVAADPSSAFAIDFREVPRRSLVGIYHSHVRRSAQPTPTDRSFAWDGLLYLIVAVDESGVFEHAIFKGGE